MFDLIGYSSLQLFTSNSNAGMLNEAHEGRRIPRRAASNDFDGTSEFAGPWDDVM
jgi:hypothetical protein